MNVTRILGLTFILLVTVSTAQTQCISGASDHPIPDKKALKLNDQGVELIKAERYREAVEVFTRAIQCDSDYATAYNNLGIAYGFLGQQVKGMQALQHAVRIKPDYAEAHYNIGRAHSDERRYEEAVKCYQLAIALKPDFALAHNNLGVAYNDWGRLKEATIAYRQAIQLKPDYAEAFNNLGTAQADLGHYRESVDSFERALALKPKLSRARFNLGVAYLRMKDREAALAQHKLLQTFDGGLADRLYGGIYQGKILSVINK